jgi:hypothetical protein
MSAKSKGPFGINACQHKGVVLNNGAEIKQKHMHMHLTATFLASNTCCYLCSLYQTTHTTHSMDFPLIKEE